VYTPEPLRYTAIPKDNGIRKVYFAAPRDSVVIQATINVIGPEFEAIFHPSSYGNRLSTGRDESHEIYRRWQDQYSRYVSAVKEILSEPLGARYLITDIENYYPSIKLERLKGLVALRITDDRILNIINTFLDLQAVNLDEGLESVGGLPAGTCYADFFANVYLDEFDKLAASKASRYARYVDDICLVCPDKKTVDELETELADYLDNWQQGFKPGLAT